MISAVPGRTFHTKKSSAYIQHMYITLSQLLIEDWGDIYPGFAIFQYFSSNKLFLSFINVWVKSNRDPHPLCSRENSSLWNRTWVSHQSHLHSCSALVNMKKYKNPLTRPLHIWSIVMEILKTCPQTETYPPILTSFLVVKDNSIKS